MIQLLVALLLLIVIFGLFTWVLQMFPLPHPFNQIAMVVLALILVLVLVSILMGGVQLPLMRM